MKEGNLASEDIGNGHRTAEALEKESKQTSEVTEQIIMSHQNYQ